MTYSELNPRLIEASHELDAALDEHKLACQEAAETERIYRRGKAIALLQARGSTVAEREANAELLVVAGDDTLTDARYRRDLAESLMQAGLEAVRSRRAQLSAIQTMANLTKAEAEFARTGPQEGP
jgi:hypothetical protein